MSVFFCFSTNYKSPSSTNSFILRKLVENRCDMAYQKCCKIVVSKRSLFALRDPAPLMEDKFTTSQFSQLRPRESDDKKNGLERFCQFLVEQLHFATHILGFCRGGTYRTRSSACGSYLHRFSPFENFLNWFIFQIFQHLLAIVSVITFPCSKFRFDILDIFE